MRHRKCPLVLGNGAVAMSEEIKLDEASGETTQAVDSNLQQPSTSAVSSPSAPTSQRLSVYSHIPGIQQIGRLRGLRSGRRRARFRGMRKTTIALKYAEALSILEPIFLEESLRLEEAHTLVAAAIEHFAITVSGIVDQLEGKTPDYEYADKIEKFKQRARTQKPVEAKPASELSPEQAAQAEEERQLENALRLEEEAVAAVAALSSGDTRGEQLPALMRLADRLEHFAAADDDRTDDSSDSDYD